MFTWLIKAFLAGMAIKRLNAGRRLSVQLLRIEAAKFYLHGVRIARLSAFGLIRMWLMMVLFGLGVLLLHVGLFILLPCSLELKALVVILLGFAYVVIAAISLRSLMDEKSWMENSGAAAMLDQAVAQSEKK